MIEADRTRKWKKKVLKLYVEVYSEGLSRQHVQQEKLIQFVEQIYSKGYLLVAHDKELLQGALFVIPASADPLFPESYIDETEIELTDYVAELMVAKSFRSQGIASKLMNEAERLSSDNSKKNMLIRVWSENSTALSLYLKRNYKELCKIYQDKLSPEGNTFKMEKLYLLKRNI